MDKIQKVLVEMGRKDLAQQYYKKIVAFIQIEQPSKELLQKIHKSQITDFSQNPSETKWTTKLEYVSFKPINKNFYRTMSEFDFKLKSSGELFCYPAVSHARQLRKNLKSLDDLKEAILNVNNKLIWKDLFTLKVPYSIQTDEISKEHYQAYSRKREKIVDEAFEKLHGGLKNPGPIQWDRLPPSSPYYKYRNQHKDTFGNATYSAQLESLANGFDEKTLQLLGDATRSKFFRGLSPKHDPAKHQDVVIDNVYVPWVFAVEGLNNEDLKHPYDSKKEK